MAVISFSSYLSTELNLSFLMSSKAAVAIYLFTEIMSSVATTLLSDIVDWLA